MKIYQCLRAYDLYIPFFEEKYQIHENNFSFTELRNLLINDGFASTYILKPGLEGNEKDFFYTLWNYKTLQYKWAEENGLKTKNLEEIKLAQIEEFKPDVYYNFSPKHDTIEHDKILNKKNLVKVCWDATILKNYPPFHEKYDLRVSLFEPYITFWKQHGYKSELIPPAFPVEWDNLIKNRKDIDILFYGQYNSNFFSSRNEVLRELMSWSKNKGYSFKLHMQFPDIKRPLLNIRGLKKFTRWLPAAPQKIMNNALPPIYGQQLYNTISRSKIVVNAFTDNNGMFKDNMRNYESIGCGAVLISEDGIYPENYIPNKDFFTYRNTTELFEKIEYVIENYDDIFETQASKAREKLKNKYSKDKQWEAFNKAINTLQ